MPQARFASMGMAREGAKRFRNPFGAASYFVPAWLPDVSGVCRRTRRPNPHGDFQRRTVGRGGNGAQADLTVPQLHQSSRGDERLTLSPFRSRTEEKKAAAWALAEQLLLTASAWNQPRSHGPASTTLHDTGDEAQVNSASLIGRTSPMGEASGWTRGDDLPPWVQLRRPRAPR
ncbi:hypothetical protein CPLU01_12386 [Colletotrichum plurivorum]|uniref:Uncharacterized protein n=1 Tax=Colletotrichum plurivorum TaxID=2175906 RepID=A0A8H6JZB2_9PEZI|nr:hypothetical protein CPLU01_12386 [Colletotrichum plurivorum]